MPERANIRSRLKKNNLTHVWLINRLQENGIVTDKSELSSVFAGTRNGMKVDAILKTTNDLLDKYEAAFSAPKS